MLVPSKEIIVLLLLLITHFKDIVVDLCENEEICEGYVISHEKCSWFKMFLEMLSYNFRTFLNSLPSFKWVLIYDTSVAYGPSPKKNDFHCGKIWKSSLQIWNI